ncbi:MAG: hypothetical protein U5R31_04765 [Acidimicrobiia bacterium]|nr:hypothetical protein [Acidimicrobiia bacterium]
MQYANVFGAARRACPDVAFELRPFRPDLLVGGDAVADLCRGVLDLDDLDTTGWHRNVGAMPLELTRVLHGHPLAPLPGSRSFGDELERAASGQSSERPVEWLASRSRAWDIPESAGTTRSREMLRRYAWATFEPANRRLIDREGWPTDHFATPPERTAPADDSLAVLDELWSTPDTETTAQYLVAALGELAGGDPAERDRSSP